MNIVWVLLYIVSSKYALVYYPFFYINQMQSINVPTGAHTFILTRPGVKLRMKM